jgi:hypothetical protein
LARAQRCGHLADRLQRRAAAPLRLMQRVAVGVGVGMAERSQARRCIDERARAS